MRTVSELLAHAQSKLGCAYVWGATGQKCTAAFLEDMRLRYYKSTSSQCPWNDGNNGYSYKERCKHWLIKAEGGEQDEVLQSFDCGGLFDNLFGINTTAAGYYAAATRKGAIGSIPKAQAGLQVFKVNSVNSIVHVGCYMGDGTVIEAKNTAEGVVRTTFAGAGWDLWAECYLIDYTGGDDMIICKKGDKDSVTLTKNVITMQKGLVKLKYKMINDSGVEYGADGNYGGATANGLELFLKDRGVTSNGEVYDDLANALMLEALETLETGVSQEQYDQKVAELEAAEAQLDDLQKQLNAEMQENTELMYQISQLQAQVKKQAADIENLKQQLATMSIDLAKANVKGKAYDELTAALATVKKHTP